MAKIRKISDETKKKLEHTSAFALPDNPSGEGYKPEAIKAAFYKPIIDANTSAVAEIDRVTDEVNEVFQSLSAADDFDYATKREKTVLNVFDGSDGFVYELKSDDTTNYFDLIDYTGDKTKVIVPRTINYTDADGKHIVPLKEVKAATNKEYNSTFNDITEFTIDETDYLIDIFGVLTHVTVNVPQELYNDYIAAQESTQDDNYVNCTFVPYATLKDTAARMATVENNIEQIRAEAIISNDKIGIAEQAAVSAKDSVAAAEQSAQSANATATAISGKMDTFLAQPDCTEADSYGTAEVLIADGKLKFKNIKGKPATFVVDSNVVKLSPDVENGVVTITQDTQNQNENAYTLHFALPQGKGFKIDHIYSSVALMKADINNSTVSENGFAFIDTGDREEADDSTLWFKHKDENGNFVYKRIGDLSGVQGATGTMIINSVSVVENNDDGTTGEPYVINNGTPQNALLDIGIPKGEKGDKGDKGDAGSFDTELSTTSTNGVQNKVIAQAVNDLFSQKANKAIATETEDGLMSASDKFRVNRLIIRGSDVAIGVSAQSSEENYSRNNVAIGYNANTNSALCDGNTYYGSSCVAVGTDSIAVGGGNTALGCNATAFGDNNGSYNTALGNAAEVRDCYDCVALGFEAVVRNGWYNTALGGLAFICNGDNNTALGYDASVCVGSDTIQLGNSDISTFNCKVALTVTSDERDKTDIEQIDSAKALDFITSLDTFTYVDNDRHKYLLREKNENGELDENGENNKLYDTYGFCDYDREAHQNGTLKGDRRRVGCSAQQLQQKEIELFGNDNYARIVNDNQHDLDEKPPVENQLTVDYTALIPFLMASVKELKSIIEQQAREIKALKGE